MVKNGIKHDVCVSVLCYHVMICICIICIKKLKEKVFHSQGYKNYFLFFLPFYNIFMYFSLLDIYDIKYSYHSLNIYIVIYTPEKTLFFILYLCGYWLLKSRGSFCSMPFNT